MTTTRDIRLNVIAEIREFQKEMAKVPGVTEKQAARAAVAFVKAQEKAQRDAAKIAQKAAGDAAKAWEDVGSLIVAAISVDALQSAATEMFNFTAEIFAARTEIINLSEATGISTETLAGLEIAAERSGVRFDEVAGGLEDFGEVLFDFSLGGGRAKEALELLDIEVKNVDGSFRETDTVLREVLEGMVGVEDQATKNAIAQQLFGDAGNRLNAILSDGSLEEYVDVAERFGTVVDDEAVAATEEWNRAIAGFSVVLRGASSDVVEFVNLGSRIREFTAGFVFLKGIAGGVLDELGSRFVTFGTIISATLAGDFGLAASTFVEGMTSVDDSFNQVIVGASEQTVAFLQLTAATDEGTDAIDRRVTSLGALSEETEKASKVADKRAAEEKKRAKEALDEIKAIGKAEDDLAKIVRDAGQDQLSTFELIEQGRMDQTVAIEELERTLGRTAETEAARNEVNAQALREETEAIAEFNTFSMGLAIELDEQDAELKAEQQERIRRNRDASLQATQMLIGASDDLLSIQVANVTAAGQATASQLSEEQALREQLAADLEAAATAEEAADIERQLAAVDRSIERNDAILANEQGQITKLFNTRKALSIVTTIISGAAAGVGALAPPPIGLGPVAGIPLAVAVAATTGAQIAVIASQSPPQFDAGFAGFTSGPDNFQATLREGEVVLNQRGSEAVGGQRGADELNRTGGTGSSGLRRAMVGREMLQRMLGQMVVDELGQGRELTQDFNRRTQRRAGVRPVYLVR